MSILKPLDLYTVTRFFGKKNIRFSLDGSYLYDVNCDDLYVVELIQEHISDKYAIFAVLLQSFFATLKLGNSTISLDRFLIA
ncbi:hypothetical protein U14_04727 [Candidatus Moduliflexus flocculans]|uniref:Uncharacterized protein n=1 Tax=Candidatus Moduliflexus flocculans TaxID=1499966 RepID=A0A0S6W648_9BACT|nr:hypothetical protein U14_04727 [Candidatus Moduliflexus flocculans]